MTTHPCIFAALCLAPLLQSQGIVAPKFRLDDTVRPLRYAVDLTLIPENDTFSGTVAIDLEVRRATPVIWMHGVDLDIREARITARGRTVPATPKAAANEILGFALEEPLQPGRARLQVTYHAKIAKKRTDGVFAVQDGPDWYAYTQFEAVDARRAFPCFDEPRFKTPWQVTLHVKQAHLAFSNTPVASETAAGGMKTVRFAETRPLPSYLVAFAAGPFEVVDAGRAGKKETPLRIVVPRGKTAQAGYARQAIAPLLTLLEAYVQIPYPYEKLDSIAAPIFPGAMENPGLIVYGQTLLLARPGEETIGFRRSLASIAAHEMAHMWFGDLVTMTWWDDIWLNEAAATWMAAKIVQQWKPDWASLVAEVSFAQMVMGHDGLVTARKIRQPVESKNDIANAFDMITYTKGGAVIGMFEHWLGTAEFRRGITEYLSRHAWGNAVAADFLRTVGARRSDLVPAFASFLDQPGVPLVSVTLDCSRADRPVVALEQKRLLPLGSTGSSGQVWSLPVCVKTGGGRECTLMTRASMKFPLSHAKTCPAWLDANADQAGYYRVRYGGALLDSLLRNTNALAPAERIGLLGDAAALMNSGDLEAARALALVPRFSRDADRNVVSQTVAIATWIEQKNLVPPELRANYARFICASYGERARQLGWRAQPGEPEETRLLRPTLVRLATSNCGDPAMIAEARDLASRWLEDRRAIAPDMIEAVLVTAAQFGDAAFLQRLRTAAKQTRDRGERRWVLRAMGSFGDPQLAAAAMQLILDDDFDPRESIYPLLFAPLRNPRTAGVPFEFVRQHYDAIAARLPGGLVGDYTARLPVVASPFCDEERRREAEAFFKDRSAHATGGPRILAQVLEIINLCTATRAAQQPAVAEFLRQY